MQFKTHLQSKLSFFVALSFAFVLASCGSYQYVGYDNDGIYSSNEGIEENTYESTYEDASTVNNSYYKNYFGEKAQQYNNIPDEDIIFTDIDSYEGDYNDENEDVAYDEGYAGWGQDTDEVTINIYNNSWANNPWYFGRYNSWNGYYGFGWNNWNSWNNWNFGFGYYNSWYPSYFNYGYYNPYWYGYGNYYHNNYAYSSIYGRRNVAYSSSRRGSTLFNSNRTNYTRRNSSNLSRSNASSITRPRVNSVPRRSTNSSVRPRTTNSRPRVNSTPRSNNNSSVKPRRNNSTPRVNSTPRKSSSSSSSSRGSSSRSSSGSSSRRGN